jgi:hypothetical protein
MCLATSSVSPSNLRSCLFVRPLRDIICVFQSQSHIATDSQSVSQPVSFGVEPHLQLMTRYEGKSISKLQMDIELKQIRVLI